MKNIIIKLNKSTFAVVIAAIVLSQTIMPLQAADLVWDAGENSQWDTTSTNWTGTATWNNSTPDNATFGATGAGTVTLTEPITAGVATVSSTANYSFTGPAGSFSFANFDSVGSGALTFNNGMLAGSGIISNTAGTLTMNGVNSAYSGTINHSSGGNLYVNNANSLGTGTLNLSGGFLTSDNSPNLSSALTINATGGRLGGAGVNDTLGLSGTVNFNSGGSGVTFNNSINNRALAFRNGATVGGDAPSVIVGRATTFIDAGVNWNYSGDLRMVRTGPGASVLNLGNGVDLSSTGSDSTIVVVDDGSKNDAKIVQVSAGSRSAKIGDVLLQENTDGVFDLNVGAGSTLTVAGEISHDGDGSGVDINGGGTVLMTATNTYAGRTAVQAGTLQLADTGSLACNAISVSSGATFDVFDGYSVAAAKTISGAGILRANGDIAFEDGSTVSINTLEVAGGDSQSNLSSTSISKLSVSGGTVTLSDSKDWSEITVSEGSTGIVDIAVDGITTDNLTLFGDGTLIAADNTIAINAGGTVNDNASFATIEADASSALSLQGENLVSNRTVTLTGGTTTISGLPTGSDMGATLNYDAASDTDSDASWESTTGIQTLNWTLGANITRTSTLTGAPKGITAAYDFPTSGSNNDADKATSATYQNNVSANADASWEFWMQADDLATDQTLWESGGSADGSSLLMKSDGTILFTAKNGGASAIVTNAFPTDGNFHNVVVTLDMNASGTTDILKMYIDGVLVDTDDSQTAIANWSGGDGAGLGGYNGDTGGRNGVVGDVSYGTFDGRFAIVRFYEDTVLDATQVADNYQVITAPGVNLTNTDIHVSTDSTIYLKGSGAAALGELSFDDFTTTLIVSNDTYDAVSDLADQWSSQKGISCVEYESSSYAVFRALPSGTVILVL